jgi:hypothetical protein
MAVSARRGGGLEPPRWLHGRAGSGRNADCLGHYLPQSFIGMVWHQQLVAAAVGVGVGAGTGAGEIKESRTGIKVRTNVMVFNFLLV